MIAMVDDTKGYIHLLGMGHSHVSSLCRCLKIHAGNNNVRLTIVQRLAREIPARTFYAYSSVHILFMQKRDIEILSAMIIDSLFIQCDFFLDEILECIYFALETAVDYTPRP